MKEFTSMSYDIGPIGSAPNASQIGASASRTQASSRTDAQLSAIDDAVSVDTAPAGPPPGLSEAIATASAAYDALRASGRQIHFTTDETGAFSASLQDLDGNHVSTIASSQVLAIAGWHTE
jgi:ABC-type transporter Mla subunit MlaD